MPSIRHPSNSLLQALSRAELEALRPHLQSIELVRETVLVEAGRPLTHVCLPLGGAISMMVRLSEGQNVEAATIGRDSVFGASAALGDTLSMTSAVVVLPGTAFAVDVADFRAAAHRSAPLRALLARHEQALFALTQQTAACNASHSVEARLSRWLLRAHDLWGSQTMPLTQEFLAQMIGVQRNAISIVAHALQQVGVISYSRGHIDIRDVDGLRQTSCECYSAVKAHHHRLLNFPHRSSGS
jgi:CRP-like cAMP-binding protein